MGNKADNKSYVTSPAARAMMRNLAVNVRALRQLNGWSMKELGDKARIPWRVIENIEQEYTCPSFVAVAWLAEVFDVTVNRLIYYPLEAIDGRAKDFRSGRFAVPGRRSKLHAPRTRADRKADAAKSADRASGAVHPTEAD